MASSSSLTNQEIEISNQANVSIKDAEFLKSLTGRSISLLEFKSEYGEESQIKGLYSYIDYRLNDEVVINYYDKFLIEGKLFFIGESDILNKKVITKGGIPGVSGEWCEKICLLSTTFDQFELIKLNGIGWDNCNIDTELLLRKAKEWNTTFGLKIYHVTHDYLAAKIINTNIDYLILAKEIHEMCADPENTDTTIEERAEGIKKFGVISLWWD